MKMLLNCFKCFKQSDWAETHIYHIIIYSWHRWLTCNDVSSDLTHCDIKGEQVEDFNQITGKFELTFPYIVIHVLYVDKMQCFSYTYTLKSSGQLPVLLKFLQVIL